MHSNKHIFLFFASLFLVYTSIGQVGTPELIAEETIEAQEYDALKPSKAAFYSAVLPGLGQIKNKDYWKAPVVWAALSTGVYFAVDNNNEFNRYRNAFKARLVGRQDEFTTLNEDGTFTQRVSDDGLVDAQDFFRKQKEISVLVTVGMYILQVIEANVDAHLSQFDVEDRLTINTSIELDYYKQATYGLRLTYHID